MSCQASKALGVDEIPFELPSSLCMDDFKRVPHRSGHVLVWEDARQVQYGLGRYSVWGKNYSSMSVQCRLQGHRGCKIACSVLKAGRDDMDAWLIAGNKPGMTAQQHMALQPGGDSLVGVERFPFSYVSL
jgi:hypothetical protein